MTDLEFRAFLDLLMCSDPWPISDQSGYHTQMILIEFADRMAKERGFPDWNTAYHKFKPDPRVGPTGDFDMGKVAPDDEGGLMISMEADRVAGVVRINFGKPLTWAAMRPGEARVFANGLVSKADEIDAGRRYHDDPLHIFDSGFGDRKKGQG